MITALAHVCFVVQDLEPSLHFYCDQLGLPKAFDFINDEGKRFGVYIKVGARSFIEIFEGTLAPRAESQSYGHCCLEVDDIEATVAALRIQGIEVGKISMGSDHSWQAWLADPDGNRIELHQYTPESWQTPWVK